MWGLLWGLPAYPCKFKLNTNSAKPASLQACTGLDIRGYLVDSWFKYDWQSGGQGFDPPQVHFRSYRDSARCGLHSGGRFLLISRYVSFCFSRSIDKAHP